MKPGEARAAVGRFLASEGRGVTPDALAAGTGTPSLLQHPDLGPLTSLRGTLGSFWVSARGQVVQYAGPPLPGPPPARGQPVPTAYERGQAFVRRHVDDFAQRGFVASPPATEGGRMVLRWTEQPRPGQEVAVFPNWIELVLDLPDGGLHRCSLSDLRMARQTAPGFTRAQVLAWVKARHGPKSAVEDLALQLRPQPGADPRDPSPPAQTVWSVGIMFLGPQGPTTERVLIDADTGAQVAD